MADKVQMVPVEVISEIFGVNVDMVYRLVKSGILTREKVGNTSMYPFIENIKRYIAHLKTDGTPTKRAAANLDAAKLEGQNIVNETRALQLAELRKDVHRSDDIIAVFNSLLTRLRVALLGTGRAVFPQDKERAKQVDAHITRALTELSTFDVDDFAANGGAAYIAKLEEEAAYLDDESDKA